MFYLLLFSFYPSQLGLLPGICRVLMVLAMQGFLLVRRLVLPIAVPGRFAAAELEPLVLLLQALLVVLEQLVAVAAAVELAVDSVLALDFGYLETC